jgi:hypothetical protein
MLELVLRLEKGLSWPQFNFNAPAKLITSNEVSLYEQDQTWHIDIINGQFVLDYISKPGNETVVDSAGKIMQDQTIEIRSVWYQGIKLNLHILSKMAQYHPNYRSDFINYCQQHNLALEQGPLRQTKFWHAGVWQLNLDLTFWNQYAKIRQHPAETIDNIQNFVGYAEEKISEHLGPLKAMLQ